MRTDLSALMLKMNADAVELIDTIDAAPAHDLADAVGALQRHANLIAAAASRLARVIDESGVWADDGFRGAGRWIAFHSGERVGLCNRRVREARQLATLPISRDAAERGVLTADQVRLLCDANAAAPDRYDADTDALFAGLAVSGGTVELGRAVRAWRERAEAENAPDPAELSPDDAEQELRLHPTFGGWWDGTLHLGPDDGALLDTLIDGEVDGYLRAARDGDPSLQQLSMGALRAKALIDLVSRAARRAPGEVSSPDRYRVGIIFPAGVDAVPGAACDADLYRIVLGAHGEPLDVGRTTRRWTTAVRRAITVRDRHCTFPGCDRPPSHCDVHHCLPWQDGGCTSIANGTLLCRHHHTFVHERRWQVHLDRRQQPIFSKPDGSRHRLVSHRPRDP
jgi:hypothetical protein